jgi:hypothetical protein
LRDGDFRIKTDFAAAVFGLGIRYGSAYDQVGIVYKNARVRLLVAFVDPTAPL